MVGAVIVFLSVLALVFAYMWIVHRFLVSAAEPEDRAREIKQAARSKVAAPAERPSREAQWAH